MFSFHVLNNKIPSCKVVKKTYSHQDSSYRQKQRLYPACDICFIINLVIKPITLDARNKKDYLVSVIDICRCVCNAHNFKGPPYELILLVELILRKAVILYCLYYEEKDAE